MRTASPDRATACLLASWLLAPGLGIAIAACGASEEPAQVDSSQREPAAETPAKPAADAEAAQAAALEIFSTRCATCHGPKGAGDGPGSAGLAPPPRNFQDPAWQASVSDDHIEKIVLYGGVAVGRSPTMPGNPDLTSKPEVVAAIRDHIRGLASN